ncbi:MAG: DUF4347 domain-containing protein [Proteobacteria bacterium]|nr:DUF4347 domain-containing protein [Pseudomonadota bacterium]MBU1686665.1 DUF4347 domain-containing protein [Pseudomonadota bacterium]
MSTHARQNDSKQTPRTSSQIELCIRQGTGIQAGTSAPQDSSLEHLVLQSGHLALQNLAQVLRRQENDHDLQLFSGHKKLISQPEYQHYEQEIRSLLAPHWHGPSRELKKQVRHSLKPFRKSSGLLQGLLSTPVRITATACMLVLLGGYPAGNAIPLANAAPRLMPPPMIRQHISRQVVFIDPALPDRDLLVQSTPAGATVVLLNPSGNLIGQLVDQLLQIGPVESVHLLTHGAPGQLRLGNLVITQATLRQQNNQLRILGSLLTGSRDIYLYGCEVARGQQGRDFVQLLSRLTKADVAASDDFTGSIDQGGDWELEMVTGKVDSRAISSRNYSAILNVINPGLIIVGDGSGGGGGGGGGSYGAYYAGGAGGAGGGGDDTLNGGNYSDVIIGDGSGGGGGGYYFGGPAGVGGYGGNGNDTLNGGSGNDILFGDGFDGADGVNDGGTGGLGGGGGGGGGYSNSGGAGGIGAGDGLNGAGGGAGGAGGNGFGGALGGAGGTNANGTPGAAGDLNQISVADAGGAAYALVTGQVNTLPSLLHGAGNDTLDGGPGSDALFGMGGTNTFVFESDDAPIANNDTDTIYDFTNGTNNKIRLTTGGILLTELSIEGIFAAQTTSGTDRWIGHAAGGTHSVTIVVKNINRDLVKADFDYIANILPVLGGTFTTAGTVNDTATISPFAAVTVTDGNGDNVSVTITYTAANGTLTGTGLTGAAGSYTLTAAAPATVQSNLQGLVFHPTANQVKGGNTVVSTFTLTPNDGIGNGTADATTVVTATSINDAPTLTATGDNPTFNQGGAPVGLFSAAAASTIEPGENISEMVLTITNINDVGSESLNLDGSTISLTNGASGVTATNGVTYAVAVVGTTATVTLTKGGIVASIVGPPAVLTTTALQAIINGMTYGNTATPPNAANRVVTITSLTDTGGKANGGNDTTALAIISTVTVVPSIAPPPPAGVNSRPTFTGTPTITGSALEGQQLSLTDTGTYDADGDSVTLFYRWQADGGNILGASGATLLLGSADINKTITCTVTADDGQGQLNSTASVTTAGVLVSADSDDDGIPDPEDICPNDPDNDIDGDGVCGDLDAYPNDPNLYQYGIIQASFIRVDGGVVPGNLVDGKPKLDVVYQFTATITYPGTGSVWVIIDGYPQKMDCGPEPVDFVLSGSVECTFDTMLGPTGNHTYLIEIREESDYDPAKGPLVTTNVIPGPEIELLNGANMVGLAKALTGLGLEDLLGSSQIFSWLSNGLSGAGNNGTYVAFDNNWFYTPGQGYFIGREDQSTLPDLSEFPEVTDPAFVIPLTPGWNLITNPYGGQVPLSEVLVQYNDESPVPWSDACGNNLLINGIYYYLGDDWGAVNGFESAGGTPEAQLIPWRGYWIYVVQDDGQYSLIIPGPVRK